ncbi:hypothetical protein VTN49DRAFT_4581 [Thermomyces lanuginosus]|uniref:uncharacterized protein n=1 Tax=Thermomyces lanuginosus TaxID=5541 RepID=UPI00374204C9
MAAPSARSSPAVLSYRGGGGGTLYGARMVDPEGQGPAMGFQFLPFTRQAHPTSHTLIGAPKGNGHGPPSSSAVPLVVLVPSCNRAIPSFMTPSLESLSSSAILSTPEYLCTKDRPPLSCSRSCPLLHLRLDRLTLSQPPRIGGVYLDCIFKI